MPGTAPNHLHKTLRLRFPGPATTRGRLSQLKRSRRSFLAALICLCLTSGLMSTGVSAKVRKRAAKPKVTKPTVTGPVEFERVAPSEDGDKNVIPLSLLIEGKGFGKTAAAAKVTLTNTVSGEKSDEALITVFADNMIIARAEAPAGGGEGSRYILGLEINGDPVEIDKAFSLIKIPVEKTRKPNGRSVEVEFKAFPNPQNPSAHSLRVSPREGDEFAADAANMKVQILPAGATNITIEPGNTADRMLVTFVAPADFEVEELFVTAYDSKEPKAYERPSTDTDANEVEITRVDILSLQRRDGFGRVKIEGHGFGNYPHPTNADLELLCDRENRSSQVDERNDTHRRDKPEPLVNTSTLCSDRSFAEIKNWRAQVEKSVKVLLVPRNPDLRVERTLIMYVDDKVIDVYFEFSHFEWFSEPFRLESVSVSVSREEAAKKAGSKPAGESSHASNDPAASPATMKTYLASHDIGPPKDLNLEYRYTVLDQKDASQLFGSGVGDHFYAVQISLVNKGDKKVIVPLSSIQAEIEWAYGSDNDEEAFDEGPATLSPLPLSAISSYFDAFQKTKGRRAKLFNVLDGVVTLGAAMVPVFGRNIERPIAIMSGGLIPGLRKSFGDLSSQQLQNLTSMSWEGVEEIPAGGGKEKFIYVQRSDQTFSGSVNPVIRKQIKSIAGLEVSGFVVRESSTAAAVKQQ